MTYLRALYHGNPAAFSFVVASLGLIALALWHTRDRLCDKEFDAAMERYELERIHARQRERQMEIETLERMWTR
jgi:hypothetical protein